MEDSIWLLWVVMDSRGRRSQPQIPYVKENAPYVKTFWSLTSRELWPKHGLDCPAVVSTVCFALDKLTFFDGQKKNLKESQLSKHAREKCASTGK